MDEKALIRQVKAGDLSAYKRLFLHYFSIIKRFLSRMLQDEVEAEDIAQNIFMKVWINRHLLDENKSIKGYLYTLAKNEAFNHLRRRRRVKIGGVEFDLEASDSPTDSAEFHDVRSRIHAIIDAMPMQRKTVFLLSRYDHLTSKQIAQQLNLSVRTVEKHLELALKDIKKQLPS